MIELRLLDGEVDDLDTGPWTRITHYDQDAVNRALDFIRKGNRVVTACRAVGISDDTYAQWVEERPDFRLAVQAAEAVAEASIVEIIVQLIKGATAVTTKTTTNPDGTGKKEETTTKKSDFAALRYMLEHRFPEWRLNSTPLAEDTSNDDEFVVNYVDNHPGALTLDPD
jgi:hypothetical protein